MNERREYIGDSVYVAWDGFTLTLTTENGFGPTNTIHLEPAVYQALVEFVGRIQDADDAERQEG